MRYAIGIGSYLLLLQNSKINPMVGTKNGLSSCRINGIAFDPSVFRVWPSVVNQSLLSSVRLKVYCGSEGLGDRNRF